jgi:Arm DNA-binding domain
LRSVNDLVNDSPDPRPIGGRAGLIRRRRNGYQVIVYAGIDPVTGRQRQISRQVKGKREAERLEGKLRAEVSEGRHRGSAARTVAELLDTWLAWRQAGGKPISPRPSTTTAA